VINLPVVGDIDSYYEAREGMLITCANTLTVSDHFQLSRFGQIELFQGGRPRQFTEDAFPNVAGYIAHLDDLAGGGSSSTTTTTHRRHTSPPLTAASPSSIRGLTADSLSALRAPTSSVAEMWLTA